MGHLPYAFSVHHFISTVGADAGFASILGLAILVLLFFAQARETTSLRDELAEAGERVQGLEARLAQLTRGNAAGSPAASAAAAAASPGAMAARQGASSAEGAPARAGVPLQPVGTPAPAVAAAPAAALAGSGAPPGVGAPAQGAATRLVPDLTTVQPPVTAAATAAGAASAVAERTAPPAPAPAPAPVAAGGNGGPMPPAPDPPPRVQIRSGAGAPTAARRPGTSARPAPRQAPAGPSRGRQVLAGLLALALVAAVVVVLVLITSGGGQSHSGSAASAPVSNAPVVHRHQSRPGSAAVVPSSVTVAVLNGTATNGLAHRVAVKLAAGGFKQGNVTTGVDQTRTATTVAYLPGKRAAGLAVASTLKLGSASVAPADQTTRTVACQGLSATACSAQTVIVTVGSDLANIQ